MDTTSLIIMGLLVIAVIVSIVFGILSFIKYGKTGERKFILLGILLTFIIPGLLLYFVLRFYVLSPTIVYMPGPGPNMDYMPGPV